MNSLSLNLIFNLNIHTNKKEKKYDNGKHSLILMNTYARAKIIMCKTNRAKVTFYIFKKCNFGTKKKRKKISNDDDYNVA